MKAAARATTRYHYKATPTRGRELLAPQRPRLYDDDKTTTRRRQDDEEGRWPMRAALVQPEPHTSQLSHSLLEPHPHSLRASERELAASG
jgi:hypothetical protein